MSNGQQDLNPYAFPWALSGRTNESELGMSLRDYFAAKAIQSHIFAALQLVKDSNGEQSKTADDIALACYQIADAMLKAREAK